MSVLFERFISRERNEPPDIDVDFEHERREEVIQYLYDKYGRDRAALTATVISYRPRSAIRDVGKALGFDADDRSTRWPRSTAGGTAREVSAERLREAGLDPDDLQVRQLLQLTGAADRFSAPPVAAHRRLRAHAGAARARLVPIENAAMPDRTVIQWDKDDLDALGLLKVDVLALGMLTAIRKALDFIGAAHGPRLQPAGHPGRGPEPPTT